jgi:uncharacterized phiE125 gp8 family phage protein
VSLRLIVAPTTEPVSLQEAKDQVRQSLTTDDTLITGLIVAARIAAEQELRRALLPQTWELTLDHFPNAIRLDNAPLISVDSVKYLDDTGTLQTLSPASYIVDDKSEPAWLQPAYTYDWPTTYPEINAVRVRFQCGYASAAAVPQAIKQWILLMVGHYYENREAGAEFRGQFVAIPFISTLLDPFRIWAV